MLQAIQNKILQQLLVGNPDFDRLTRWTMLSIPAFYKWDVLGTSSVTRAHVKWPGGPKETDTVGSVVGIQWPFLHQRGHEVRQYKFLIVA